jgi:hypothetical protein
MLRTRHLLLATLLTLILSGIRVTYAAEVDHATSTSASASLASTSGCLVTTVNLSLGTRGFHAPGDSPKTPYMEIDDLNVYDACTDTYLMSAFYTTTDFTFTVDPQLASATLIVDDLPLIDCGGDLCASAPASLDVAVTWTASGDLVKTQFNVKGNGSKVTGTEVTRPVTAAGTVTDGTTNFSPVPTTEARLSRLVYTGVS